MVYNVKLGIVYKICRSNFTLKRHKKAIDRLLDRINKWSFGNFNVFCVPQQEVKEEVTLTNQPQTDDEWMIWIQKHSVEVLTWIKTNNESLFFERTLNLVFGTQLKILTDLEIKGVHGERYSVLYNYFLEHQKISNAPATAASQYFAYLTSCGFIEINGEFVRITQRGINFLIYIRTIYSSGIPFRIM